MTVPVLLAVGDEDVRCLETKPDAQVDSPQRWASGSVPNNWPRHQSGRSRFAFNAQIENFLGAVERGNWPSRIFQELSLFPTWDGVDAHCRDNSSGPNQ